MFKHNPIFGSDRTIVCLFGGFVVVCGVVGVGWGVGVWLFGVVVVGRV